MIKIIGFVVALCLSMSAWANHFTVCDFQGDAAKNVIMLKKQNMSVEAVIARFEAWYGIVSLEDALTPEHRATIRQWMAQTSKYGSYVAWITQVYTLYDDPALANGSERNACIAANGPN